MGGKGVGVGVAVGVGVGDAVGVGVAVLVGLKIGSELLHPVKPDRHMTTKKSTQIVFVCVRCSLENDTALSPRINWL